MSRGGPAGSKEPRRDPPRRRRPAELLRALLAGILGPRFVLGCLAAGAVYFVILLLARPVSWFRAFFVTLGLLTGGDPYQDRIYDTVHPWWVTWWLGWGIHLAGWLLVPVLAGLLVAAAGSRLREVRRGLAWEIVLGELGVSSREEAERLLGQIAAARQDLQGGTDRDGGAE
jgi:hypothetical protein